MYKLRVHLGNAWIRLLGRLPFQYRILCGQFLLRIVDLESLAVEADVPRFLGQCAGVLLMLSLLHAVFIYVAVSASPWLVEQYLIRTMMLVAGLIVVLSWESTFPDRTDLAVLGALPLPPGAIPAAKVSAVCALLGLALLALNAVPGFELPLLLGQVHGTAFHVLRVLGAYWATMLSATVFLYGAVLTTQGVSALLLPRRAFLWVSAALQVFAFALLFGMYFLEPMLTTPGAMAAESNRIMLAWSPQFWFFGIFHQLSGDLPAALDSLALQGWSAVSAAIVGAFVTLRWSYTRVMRLTLEEADLLPSRWAKGSWVLPLPGELRRAMVWFSAKALARSRHHRLVCAIYAALVLSIGLSSLREARSTAVLHLVTPGFLMGSVAMMALAVTGLRSLFSLPISLHANWIWRLTESAAPEPYRAATRTVLLLFAVGPVWLFAAGISCFYRPWGQAAEHGVVLLLLGMIFVELNLLRFQKAPFACAYLPGRSNVQTVFWTAVLVLLPLTTAFAQWERRVLQVPGEAGALIAALCAAEFAFWVWNRTQGNRVELDFEDAEPELLVTLGLGPR